jgi:hypothetical protein
VSVVGSPTLTATAAADGTFSLEAPVGRVALRVAASGYWNAPAVVTFTNVAPGSTGASVAGSPGRSTCSVRPAGNASWPVEAKAITFVHAVCTR